MLKAGIPAGKVIVRSSGTAETMKDRGRLVSAVCEPEEVAQTVASLASTLTEPNFGAVHWIVQAFVPPVRRGHLSNERRVSKEKRDWIAEFEPQGNEDGFMTRIAVRRWRDGDAPDLGLRCSSTVDATSRLKAVALWATQVRARLHFEWVWSGSELRVVQVDLADTLTGVDPRSLRPKDVPTISPVPLQAFRHAEPRDFSSFSKLHNASVYRELGYDVPAFFVLQDATTISAILGGTIPPALDHDLKALTARPLIIRTDGSAIPADKHQMLPRSDELRSAEDARNWLTSKFSAAIRANRLENSELCLIAHHFIPSMAAAWARAEPRKRMVRIESLWGSPEGLYWYSHDTFEVDTVDNSTEKLPTFTVRERLRHKGTFIAADDSGRWVPHRTAPPYDWAPSIKRDTWLREIAATTRRVAEREGHPIVLMWFIDNDPRATPHQVLPWFHSQSQLGMPKAAPRRKLTFAADFRVETTADWQALKAQVGSGTKIERVVIEPKDTDLVRSQEFAEELAHFAAANNIVVELAGGILSHAYYMLQAHGAQVECIDLFGGDEDVIEYNKLVRDKIPDLIQVGGEDVEVVQLRGDALLASLRQKLVEEAFEAIDAKSADELTGELADIAEVIYGICAAIGVSREQLEEERIKKAARRGGFEQGIMLKRTSLPRSLSVGEAAPAAILAIDTPTPPTQIIQEPSAIPTSPPYRRADLRNVGQHAERLLTFETDVNKLSAANRPTEFSVLLERESQRFSITVELSRSRNVLRGTVRVRSEIDRGGVPESQLSLDFKE
jgi:predicted house-cleaning noncanonical NTP pyrophosphatase (MazG superfamily)